MERSRAQSPETIEFARQRDREQDDFLRRLSYHVASVYVYDLLREPGECRERIAVELRRRIREMKNTFTRKRKPAPNPLPAQRGGGIMVRAGRGRGERQESEELQWNKPRIWDPSEFPRQRNREQDDFLRRLNYHVASVYVYDLLRTNQASVARRIAVELRRQIREMKNTFTRKRNPRTPHPAPPRGGERDRKVEGGERGRR